MFRNAADVAKYINFLPVFFPSDKFSLGAFRTLSENKDVFYNIVLLIKLAFFQTKPSSPFTMDLTNVDDSSFTFSWPSAADANGVNIAGKVTHLLLQLPIVDL